MNQSIQINHFGIPVLCEQGFPVRVLTAEEITELRAERRRKEKKQ